MNKTIVCSILMLFSVSVYAADFDESVRYYQETNYIKAIEVFSELIENGAADWHVYYMLGNSYYKIKNIPKAVLWYERVLRIKPGNAMLRHNLQVMQKELLGSSADMDYDPFGQYFRRFFLSLNINVLACIVLCFLWGAAITGYIWLRDNGNNIMGAIALSAICVAVIFGAVTYARYKANVTIREAIVIRSMIPARSDPAEDGPVITTVRAGMKVRLLEEKEDWVLIRIPEQEGGAGWIEKGNLEFI